jgi:putative transposase
MKLLFKLDKEKDKKIRKKIRKKVSNLKDEMRNQSANFIAKRYDLVLMPKLESGKLCIKASRRLKTKTARALLNAGHSKFFDSLKSKCWEYGSTFLHVKEDYTSQTCPECGSLNKCNEIYKCKKCLFKHDRDVVGAMNIMFKAIR